MDIDRTSAQLEAIKQKSLDLDSRLPPVHHFHMGSDSLDGDGSRLSGGGGVGHQQHSVTGQPRAPSKFFQQSSRQLEEMLAQRLEKEAMQRASGSRKGGIPMTPLVSSASSTGTSHAAAAVPAPSLISGAAAEAASVQKLLNDEMKRHCRIIQEKHLIERRWPQQTYSAANATGVTSREASIDEEVVS